MEDNGNPSFFELLTAPSSDHDTPLNVLLHAIDNPPSHDEHSLDHSFPGLSAFLENSTHAHSLQHDPTSLSIDSLLAASQQLASPNQLGPRAANGRNGTDQHRGAAGVASGSGERHHWQSTPSNLSHFQTGDDFAAQLQQYVTPQPQTPRPDLDLDLAVHPDLQRMPSTSQHLPHPHQQPPESLQEPPKKKSRPKTKPKPPERQPYHPPSLGGPQVAAIKRKWDANDVEGRVAKIRAAIQANSVSQSNGSVGPSSLSTISCMHASASQKSYGAEKRYLCPPPMVRIEGPMKALALKPKLQMTIMSEEREPQVNERTNLFDPQMRSFFRAMHVGGATAKGKFFSLSLSLHAPTDSPAALTALDQSPTEGTPESSSSSSLAPPFAVFDSADIAVISKPSKKTAKARNTTSCILAGSTICLHNRINSQTVRTKYMSIDEGQLCARQNQWTAFSIHVLRRAEDTPGVTATLLTSRVLNGSLTVTYGSEVLLTDLMTGVSSEPLIVRKVEKKRVVLDAVGPVSQLQKLAFSKSIGGRTSYLSASQDGMDSLGNDLVQSATPAPVETGKKRKRDEGFAEDDLQSKPILTYQYPDSVTLASPFGEPESHEVNDLLTWTVTGINHFSYSYFDTFTGPEISLPSACVTPFPVVSGALEYQEATRSISFSVTNFYSVVKGESDLLPLEVWVGPLGPLKVHVIQRPGSMSNIEQTNPMNDTGDGPRTGSSGDCFISVELPTTDDIIQASKPPESAAPTFEQLLAGAHHAASPDFQISNSSAHANSFLDRSIAALADSMTSSAEKYYGSLSNEHDLPSHSSDAFATTSRALPSPLEVDSKGAPAHSPSHPSLPALPDLPRPVSLPLIFIRPSDGIGYMSQSWIVAEQTPLEQAEVVAALLDTNTGTNRVKKERASAVREQLTVQPCADSSTLFLSPIQPHAYPAHHLRSSMRSFTAITFFATVLSLVAAQSTTVPPCVLACYASSVSSSTCAATDAKCLCESQIFQRDTFVCLQASCDAADIGDGVAFGATSCQAYGIEIASTFASSLPLSTASSSWSITIHLDHEGRPSSWFDHASKWRSGEALKGRVEVTPIARVLATPMPIKSLVVRSFWQSTSVFMTQEASRVRMMAKDEVVMGRRTINHGEYHRGWLEGGGEGVELWEEAEELDFLRREVDGDFPLLGDPSRTIDRPDYPHRNPALPRNSQSTNTFDFTFVLPKSTRSNFSNPSPDAPADRANLMNFARTPPPSFDTPAHTNGSVEYFVEVVLRTGVFENTPTSPTLHEEPPSFPTALEEDALCDFRGLLQPTSILAVERIKFPFEPLDAHAQDLHSSWSVVDGAPGPPLFGRDPRDELGGSNLSKEVAAPGRLIHQMGGADRWTTYEKESPVKSVLGLARGLLRSEISLPAPAMITRHSPTLPIIFHLSYYPPSSNSFFSNKSNPLKPLDISHVTLVLYERILTRSGRASRPTMILTELRRQNIKLWDSDGSIALENESARNSAKSGGRKHLQVRPYGSEGVDLKLDFDLQSDVERLPNGQPMVRVREAGLSLRTPNIEREYIIQATIHPVGLPPFQACRCPIQLIAGDDDEAPQFEDVVAEAFPPLLPPDSNSSHSNFSRRPRPPPQMARKKKAAVQTSKASHKPSKKKASQNKKNQSPVLPRVLKKLRAQRETPQAAQASSWVAGEKSLGCIADWSTNPLLPGHTVSPSKPPFQRDTPPHYSIPQKPTSQEQQSPTQGLAQSILLPPKLLPQRLIPESQSLSNRERSRSPLSKPQNDAPILPTPEYLSSVGSYEYPGIDQPSPPLLILDLNETLVLRGRFSREERRAAIPRPYLSTFLAYISGNDRYTKKKRWLSAVFSSASHGNVLAVLKEIGLAPTYARSPWTPGKNDVLELLMTREDLGLVETDFSRRVETVKDLDHVWARMGAKHGVYRTVLLDDEKGKCAKHPFNHLPIEPFQCDSSPTSPPDAALLRAIYLLQRLNGLKNMPYMIRQGFLERTFALGNQRLEELARELCATQGIRVQAEWDPLWRRKMITAPPALPTTDCKK
ncbi:recombining binding protein suppressor of hairless, partial [Phenoliferia sp. Uapishka_3]